MARYKPIHKGLTLLPVDFDQQVMPGSFVTLVPKAKNYDCDFLVWLLYNPQYEVQEAWLWEAAAYKTAVDSVKRLSPFHCRKGKRLV